MTEENSPKPALPEPYGMIGLFIGFALAVVYYHFVITTIPNSMWPAHLIVLVLIIPIFLGVPAVFEKVYWKLGEEQ